MDIDKTFLTALAYTSITEKELDIVSFHQKVIDNQKLLISQLPKKPAKVGSKSRLGL